MHRVASVLGIASLLFTSRFAHATEPEAQAVTAPKPSFFSGFYFGQAKGSPVGAGEPPMAKKITVMSLVAVGVVSLGIGTYYYIDSKVQYGKERDFVASHGGNTNFCWNLQSADCRAFSVFHERHYSSEMKWLPYMGVGVLASVSLPMLVGIFLWPNAPVRPSTDVGRTGGTLRLEGTF